MVIPTGRDISIPIPVNTHASTEEDGTDTATLEWLVLSESSNAGDFDVVNFDATDILTYSINSSCLLSQWNFISAILSIRYFFILLN